MPETVYHHGVYDAKPGLVPWAYVAGDGFDPVLRVGLTGAEMAALKAGCGDDPGRWAEIYRELRGILDRQHICPPLRQVLVETPEPWQIPEHISWPTPAPLDVARKALVRSAEQGSGDDPGGVIGAPRHYPGGDGLWLEVLRHGLGDALAGDVLDLGCGPGRVTRIVAPHAGSVIGLDISPHVIAAAQDPALWPVPSNVEYVVGNGIDLCNFSDAAFDAVYSMFMFQHITPLSIRENYLREIRRVLKPGGKALIETKILGVGLSWWMDHVEDWGTDVSWCSADEAIEILEGYGFNVTRAWTMYGNQEPGALWLWTTLEPRP
jgi:SAM-dependent methyltransferase